MDWFAERIVDERRRKRGELSQDQTIIAARTVKKRVVKNSGPTFSDAADRFMAEFELITQGQRSRVYVDGHRRRLNGHLIPYFAGRAVATITSGDVTAYRAFRMEEGLSRSAQAQLHRLQKADPEATIARERLKKPAASTLHQEIVCLRQVLKTALRHGWIDHLPDMTKPYQKGSKIAHRAWFSNDEYVSLYQATGKRAKKPLKERWRWASEQLHDLVLFAANTGMRPDELGRLEFRDVKIVEDEATDEEILLVEVRGKRGVGYCKSMPGAVHPFTRLRERLRPAAVEGGEAAPSGRRAVRRGARAEQLPKPTDLLFPNTHRQLFNQILDELKLKLDREGQVRTLYSLRHYYICQRLMEGADIYQLAKNCRTSVEMIEKFYASHLANTLNAAAINVRAPKRRPQSAAKKSNKKKTP